MTGPHPARVAVDPVVQGGGQRSYARPLIFVLFGLFVVGLSAQVQQSSRPGTPNIIGNGNTVVVQSDEAPKAKPQTKPATVDQPLSELALVKLDKASVTLDRDLRKAKDDAETFLRQEQAKAQKAYQDALQAIVLAGCGKPGGSLAVSPEGKPPVLRCPVYVC